MKWDFVIIPNQFPAYLWGIETQIDAGFIPEQPRFQPTYEELKPQRAEKLGEKMKSFQPTYEELKRANRRVLKLAMMRFQTSYEE